MRKVWMEGEKERKGIEIYESLVLPETTHVRNDS